MNNKFLRFLGVAAILSLSVSCDKEEDVELKYNENSTQEPTKEILFRKLAN